MLTEPPAWLEHAKVGPGGVEFEPPDATLSYIPKGDSMDQFTITIDLGNAEMCKPDHVVDALREIANQVEAEGPDDFAAGNVRDANGNTVGSYGRVSERRAV